MKSETSTAPRTKKYLVSCLAALMAVSAPMGFAADNDALKKLQDENAALRKRLAALEGSSTQAAAPAAAAPAAAAGTAAKGSTMQADAGVQTLSAFEVKSDKDQGYLRTNSVTATRINMAIQNIPMSVSVMSKEFLDDANIRSITDVLRYTSSGAGDNNFAMRRPSNSATPQGGFTLRGFGVNSLLRNGISRYIGYNVNNVDRIEIVKGPASVFFGAGYPGGVINYITKQPVFGKIPTTLSYTFGDNNMNRVVLDNNTQLSKKAAMRVVGSWENRKGFRNYEFKKENSITANLTLVPFDSGKVKITFEFEHLDGTYNDNQKDWLYPDGWFQAYQNPSAALISAAGVADATAYKNRIFNGLASYIQDVRVSTGNYETPLYSRVIRGGYYTAKDGSRVHDEGFNFTNRGTRNINNVDTPSLAVELAPTSWLDARYVLTNETARYDSIEGTIQPYADGRTFNALESGASSGYYRAIQNHQFDLIFKLDGWGVKHRLLAGGVFQKQNQQYNANQPNFNNAGTNLGGFNYSQIPGITNAAGNPGMTLVGSQSTGGAWGNGNTSDVPVNQVIRDRFGVIKTVNQVYSQFDPGAEVTPDISRLFLYNRTLLDGYKTEYQAGYLNYNASLLDDRLNILAGVRREMNRDSGQYLTSNFPWYAPPNYAYTDQASYPPSAYNYDPGYAGDSNGFQRQAGTSWMAGLSYAVTKEINVYSSYSKVFRLNNGTAAGLSTLTLPDVYNAAAAWAKNAANPNANTTGAFSYRGQSITSYQGFYDALAKLGAFDVIKNEAGFNAEIGVKTALWDNKLTGTFGLFRSERRNQKLDDSVAQAAEPLNGAYSGGGNVAIFGPAGNAFSGSRIARWRTVGVRNRIEGADFEFVWSPKRNFQSVLNGSWMWTAKTLENPTVNKPGSAAYNTVAASSVYGNKIATINADLQYGERLENVPEFSLNSINKYTFTGNMLAGVSLGANARYKSTTLISRSVDWNPRAGGLTSGNFLVFDVNVGYPWEVMGYKISTQLGIYNALDKKYIEGATYILSAPRTWLLTNTLKF